jgi:Ser/Thr protein kinase RdoA (MazF antagonist)
METNSKLLKAVLQDYNLEADKLLINRFGNGLINSTWKIVTANKNYILQRINNSVFKQPEIIAENIDKIAAHLKANYPDYKFVAPIEATNGLTMVQKDDNYFRLFLFVEGSHAKDALAQPDQAYEAAFQFGKFTERLKEMDATCLQNSIPNFHNLSLRYTDFLTAVKNATTERLSAADALIKQFFLYAAITEEYALLKANKDFKIRVTHHDTKISNVLFDEADKGICVIDLDTAMPGYFISDVGDMMRTYLSPVSEEDQDFSKIIIREDFYRAIVQGYLTGMGDELTAAERKSFFYAGKFMIYMQALRFLTDYLNGDKYYATSYPTQNLVRAGNQLMLLNKLLKKRDLLESL